jgi:hypothetical protein
VRVGKTHDLDVHEPRPFPGSHRLALRNVCLALPSNDPEGTRRLKRSLQSGEALQIAWFGCAEKQGVRARRRAVEDCRACVREFLSERGVGQIHDGHSHARLHPQLVES